MTSNKKSFMKKRRNTIVMLAIVFTVLIAGYFALRGVLVDSNPETTAPPTVELMPGEDKFGESLLVYPRIERKDLDTVKIHNPKNLSYGEVYVDWGIGFAYDAESKDYYGYLLEYDYAELDGNQLAYFAIGAGYVSFTSRVSDITADTDLSVYGLDYTSDADATYMLVKHRNGTQHKIYYGKKNPSGASYYAIYASVDANGKETRRDTVYLLGVSTTTYTSSTVLAKPTEMLTARMTYPIKSMFSSFILQDTRGNLDIAFLPTNTLKNTDSVFGGSSLYYTALPKGYFSSSEFETRITIFEDFLGEETLEYATKLVEGVDEETGKPYSYYTFDDETLAKYHLDAASDLYLMMYTSAVEGSEEHAVSEVYFSQLQPDGYYYAHSLSFGTIVRVSASLVDFLEWSLLDFVDSYALRIAIGYVDTVTFKGTLNGAPFSESFSTKVGTEYKLLSARAENANKDVSVDLYRTLFQLMYNTVQRGTVPETLDKEKLMENAPYAEIHLKTRDVTVYAKDELGAPTTKVEGVVKSVTRVLRFYRYSNERTLMTIETIDANGKSNGEVGEFYVLTSRLDQLIRNADNLVKGIPFTWYDKE